MRQKRAKAAAQRLIFTLMAAMACGEAAAQNGPYGFNGTTAGCAGVDPTEVVFLETPQWPPFVRSPFNFSLSQLSNSDVAFSFVAYYTPTDSRYVIDFSREFEQSGSITGLGACSNVDAVLYAQLPQGSWWSHAPNALGVEGASAPSQTAWVQAGYWSAASDGCALVRFYGEIPLSKLVACPMSAADPSPAVEAAGGITASARGTLYVYSAAPVSPAGDESMGYSYSSWAMQFYLSAGSGSSSFFAEFDVVLSLTVSALYVDPVGGDMVMRVAISVDFPGGQVLLMNLSSAGAALSSGRAVSFSPGGGLAPVEIPSPGTYTLSFTAAPVNAEGFDGVYDGAYSALYEVTACPALQAGQCTLLGAAAMNESVKMSPLSGSGGTVSAYLATALTATAGPPSWNETPAGALLVGGERLWLLVSLSGADIAGAGAAYQLDVTDVYLCQASLAHPFSYDGASSFGCLNQTNTVALVSGGAVSGGAVVSEYYAPLVVQHLQDGLSSGQAAVSFLASPVLVDPGSGDPFPGESDVYAQVMSAVSISGAAQRRSAFSESPSFSVSFAVFFLPQRQHVASGEDTPPHDSDGERAASQAPCALPAIALIIFFVGAIPLIV